MNTPITITVDSRDAEVGLHRKIEQADPHRLATRVAVPTARHWRDHLKALPRNRGGYPSTGFWEDAARKVVGLAEGPNVRLYSDKLGLRKRLYGGPVKAVNVKNITIPLCAEAYGTTVHDWPELGNGSVIATLGDGRKFWCLWLGDDEYWKGEATEEQERFGKAFSKKVRTSEVNTRRVRKYKESVSGQNPKFIFFKTSNGSTQGRAERHMQLKFLFRLIPETKPQTPMPQVIPSDLNEVALNAARGFLK